jgi:hypothetical protein
MNLLTNTALCGIFKKYTFLGGVMRFANGSLGALFFSLFAALTGCSKYEIVPCSDDEAAYFDATLAWMEKERARMDSEMESISPDHDLTAAQILASLNEAEIKCGVGGARDDKVAATTRRLFGEVVIVDIQDPFVVNGLEMFLETQWVADYEYMELHDVDRSVHTDPFGTAYRYTLSLGDLGTVFAHEGSHLLLGDHSRETKQEVEKMAKEGNVAPEDTAHLDETFSWGYASLVTAYEIYETEIETAHSAR